MLRTGAVLLLLATGSCRMTPQPPAVPVAGTHADVSVLTGEWAGRYWSRGTGRHGIIRFNLPEQADTGYGEVEITFSPALYSLRDQSPADQPETCTHIDIRVVRVVGDRVRGTMAPYWDPDCDCRASTVFEGRVEGDRIVGTFTTRRASPDRRAWLGNWEVTRTGGNS